MQDSSPLVCVMTTVANANDADRLAKLVIGQSLAACVQIDGPMVSHYQWSGQLKRETEYRLMIKTTRRASSRLMERLAKDHPYDEPEIILFHIDQASQGYATWVKEQTSEVL